jgi:hypothetical protein
MEVQNLPKPIQTTLNSLIKKAWTQINQPDQAADFVRQLRLDANALGALTEEEIEWKKKIDEKLARKQEALETAKTVEAELRPMFMAFTKDELETRNAELPVSKQKKFIEGKGWKVQLKDKPESTIVTNNELAVSWFEENEPEALKVVKTIPAGELGKASLRERFKKMGAKLKNIGIMLVPAVPNGDSSLKINDLDAK